MSNPYKVGIFSFITIVIFVFGFYFLKGINVFERKNNYYCVFERVDGLYKSNLVEIDGFPIGRVGEMKRNHETGRIVVRLDLETDFRIPKSEKTYAQLFSTDFLGSKKIKLVFGESDEFYADGDTINTFFKKDLTEQIGANIDPIMLEVRKMMPMLDTTIYGLQMMFDEKNPNGVNTTILQLNQALYKLNAILAANEANLQLTFKHLEAITGNVEKNNAQITNILENFSAVSDSLQQANLKQTIQNLNTTIGELNGLVNDINAGKGTLGKVIKDDKLYASVDSAVLNMNVLLKDIKARPYRYIRINVLGSKKAEERQEKKYNESN
ncbi:MAG: MCE family protein [Bacteroidetes bacterium]|nr:MCE family protein [Bacteroidota bacterium]